MLESIVSLPLSRPSFCPEREREKEREQLSWMFATAWPPPPSHGMAVDHLTLIFSFSPLPSSDAMDREKPGEREKERRKHQTKALCTALGCTNRFFTVISACEKLKKNIERLEKSRRDSEIKLTTESMYLSFACSLVG